MKYQFILVSLALFAAVSLAAGFGAWIAGVSIFAGIAAASLIFAVLTGVIIKSTTECWPPPPEVKR